MASASHHHYFTSEDIASGCPGLTSPLSVNYSPDGQLLTYLFPDSAGLRQLYALDLSTLSERSRPFKLFDASQISSDGLSLQEQLRRERMRLFTHGIASYEWMEGVENVAQSGRSLSDRLLVPLNGKAVIYDHSESNRRRTGDDLFTPSLPLCVMGDESELASDFVDPHLSPNGENIAYVMCDDLYVQTIDTADESAGGSKHTESSHTSPIRLTTDGARAGVTCGLADFVSQEEMGRFRGFWWSPNSQMIAYTQVDESRVPELHITHQGKDDPTHRETHRYPFAGSENPVVTLAVVHLNAARGDDKSRVVVQCNNLVDKTDARFHTTSEAKCAPNEDGNEVYIARVGWWPDNSLMVQIQNRAQTVLQLLRVDPHTGARTILLEETSEYWVNITDMLHVLPRGYVPASARGTGVGAGTGGREHAFHFIWCSERTGFKQLYLYEYGGFSKEAINLSGDRPIGGGGDFVVDSIDGVDASNNIIYFSGNCDAPTEKHLFAAHIQPPLHAEGSVAMKHAAADLLQLTAEPGWHTSLVNVKSGVVTISFSSMLNPVRMTVFSLDKDSIDIALSAPLSQGGEQIHSSAKVHSHTQRQFKFMLHTSLKAVVTVLDNDSSEELETGSGTFFSKITSSSPKLRGAKASQQPMSLLNTPGFMTSMVVPEIHCIRSADDKADLYCAVYNNPSVTSAISDDNKSSASAKPCVVAVYGGPHVQRVANIWTLRADLRTQKLVQQGFVVIKCDNRGSNRRGLYFEAALHRNMGDIEVADQRTAVEHFVLAGLVDPARVGMVGWSYGGYMSAMSLCKAPDTFACAVAGAPVTSWDGYDTHYTERYMGTPQNNEAGYNSSSVMSNVESLKGKLLLVHGLIDENVHFRHTARLINALIAHRKRYDLVLFPCERHSPHRKQDRVYMEDIIFEFFSKHLLI